MGSGSSKNSNAHQKQTAIKPSKRVEDVVVNSTPVVEEKPEVQTSQDMEDTKQNNLTGSDVKKGAGNSQCSSGEGMPWLEVLDNVSNLELWDGVNRAVREPWKAYLAEADSIVRRPRKPIPKVLNLFLVSFFMKGEDIVFLATDINLPGAVDWVMMQSCFGHNFMLVLEKQEKLEGQHMFYAIVQLIGTRKQAENFAYRLELNGHRRRLTWEATPRSIHDGVQSAIGASDCLVFDTNIAQLFADHGNLGINVTISMC